MAGILAQTNAGVLQDWLKKNLSQCNSAVQNDCLTTSLAALCAVDAEAGFAFLSTINSGSVSNKDIINAIFFRFGRQSPLAAEAAASGKYAGAELDLARYNISNGAGRSDPALGIEIARKISDSDLRGKAISTRLSALFESDRASAVALLEDFNPKELQVIFRPDVLEPGSLVNRLGKSAPKLLCELLNGLAVSSANEGIFLTAMKRLSLESPENAATLLESLPDGVTKMRMVGSQFDALATENPQSAIENVSKLKSEGLKREAYKAIGSVVGTQGLDSLKVAAADIPESYRNAFMTAALPAIIHRDPLAAVTLLENGSVVPDVDERPGMLTRLGENLGDSDLAYALGWLERLSPGDQPHAMKGIALKMAMADVEGLASMLSRIPQDKTWEAGVSVLIESIKDSDPEMAKKWQDALPGNGKK